MEPERRGNPTVRVMQSPGEEGLTQAVGSLSKYMTGHRRSMMKCATCGHTEEDHMAKEEVRSGIRPCLYIERTPGGRGIRSVCGCKSFVSADAEKLVEMRFKKSVIKAIEEVHPEVIGYSVPYDAADLAWRKYTDGAE